MVINSEKGLGRFCWLVGGVGTQVKPVCCKALPEMVVKKPLWGRPVFVATY